MNNAWKIEINLPLLSESERNELFDKVVLLVMDSLPENRTYDPDISAHAYYDYLYDTRSFKFNVGDHVRVITCDEMNNAKGTIVDIEPGVEGKLPYVAIIEINDSVFKVPFEEYELELEN